MTRYLELTVVFVILLLLALSVVCLLSVSCSSGDDHDAHTTRSFSAYRADIQDIGNAARDTGPEAKATILQ